MSWQDIVRCRRRPRTVLGCLVACRGPVEAVWYLVPGGCRAACAGRGGFPGNVGAEIRLIWRCESGWPAPRLAVPPTSGAVRVPVARRLARCPSPRRPITRKRCVESRPGDGTVAIRGYVSIPTDQAWFVTPEWLAGEREADDGHHGTTGYRARVVRATCSLISTRRARTLFPGGDAAPLRAGRKTLPGRSRLPSARSSRSTSCQTWPLPSAVRRRAPRKGVTARPRIRRWRGTATDARPSAMARSGSMGKPRSSGDASGPTRSSPRRPARGATARPGRGQMVAVGASRTLPGRRDDGGGRGDRG